MKPPRTLSIEASNEQFTSYAGLYAVERLFKELNVKKKIKNAIPLNRRNKAPSPVSKFKALLYSFVLGGDCLLDIDSFRKDPLFKELTQGCAARTATDFIKNFSHLHCEILQNALLDIAFELRGKLYPEDNKLIISMDSTPHEHYSKKMEGMSFNYKNMWCLDSQNAYDQFGLSYVFDLRPGSTHSGKGSEVWIHKVFKKCPSGLERWFRADSAYSKHAVYEALEIKRVKFTIVLKENVAKSVRENQRALLDWRKSDIYFFDSGECEVCDVDYYPKDYGKKLRVVFIRREKLEREKEMQQDIFSPYDPEEFDYKYYSIVTNVGADEMDCEEVINFYRKRATAESYIREQKYGYDFLNFPCKRLLSNKVFGVIGSIAYNLVRVVSFCMPQKWKSVRNKKTKKIERVKQLGYFAKKVRVECFYIAGKVACSARRAKIKMNQSKEEVLRKVMNQIYNLYNDRDVFT